VVEVIDILMNFGNQSDSFQEKWEPTWLGVGTSDRYRDGFGSGAKMKEQGKSKYIICIMEMS
jgi:hypothetical protein